MDGDAASLLKSITSADSDSINAWQMSVRVIIVFVFGIALVRLAGRRTFGRNASLDIVTSVVLGSMLSRAITGNAPFFPTLVATAVLALLHFLAGAGAIRSARLGRLVKGGETRLIRDGAIDRLAMRRNELTEHDLMEALRLHGIDRAAEVKAAYLERNGEISAIRRPPGHSDG